MKKEKGFAYTTNTIGRSEAACKQAWYAFKNVDAIKINQKVVDPVKNWRKDGPLSSTVYLKKDRFPTTSGVQSEICATNDLNVISEMSSRVSKEENMY